MNKILPFAALLGSVVYAGAVILGGSFIRATATWARP
jgi:hypothetical protein